MAEDTVKPCKRGHPRTPENVDKHRHCKICWREKVRAYDREHPEQVAERQRRYQASTKGWIRWRRYENKKRRPAIQAKLDDLRREESCLTSSGLQMPMK